MVNILDTDLPSEMDLERSNTTPSNESIVNFRQSQIFVKLKQETDHQEIISISNKVPNVQIDKKRQIKEILKESIQTPVALGIINILFSPYFLFKIISAIFVLASSGIASYLVIQSIVDYYTYDVTSTSRIIYESPTLFPKITFCNVNLLTSEFAYNFTQMGNFDIDYSKISNEEKKKLGHDLNDILVECRFNDESCDTTDFTWSFDRHYGNCYTFNSGFNLNGSKVELKKSTLAGPDHGLQLTLYANMYEKLIERELKGFGCVIRIGNSSFKAFDSNGGILVSAGFQTHIVVEREFKHMLPKPYSKCEIDDTYSSKFRLDSDLYDLIANTDYAYSQQLCFSQCIQKHYLLKYNCTLPFIISFYNASECRIHYDKLKENFINDVCQPLCPLECNQMLYKSSISFFRLYGNQDLRYIRDYPRLSSDFINRTINEMTAGESFVHVNIFYESLKYEESTEMPKVDLVSLLGTLGGNLDMFLGLGVFTFCEVIEALFEIVHTMRHGTRILQANKSGNT